MKSRRAVLRSSSAFIALPFLESFGFTRFVKAAPVQKQDIPKRMIFLGIGYGVTKESWYPDANDTGRGYALPDGLQPLSKHREDFTVIQNLEHANSRDGHSGSTFWLTGADRFAVPGQSFHNTVSVDQVAAEHFGKETRHTSIQLNGAAGYGSGGHGPGASLAWNRQGKSLSALPSPVALFHRLFSGDQMPLEQRQALLADERSVLDTVLADARSVKRKLTQTDRAKMDEYFQSIREIETRIAKDTSWLHVPKKQPTKPVREPAESLDGVPAVRMMYELMVAAMQVDASRVFSYRMPVDSFITSFGATISAHNMSHYAGGERTEVSMKRDRVHAALLADFIDRMKATREADGSSLLDHVALTWGSNLSKTHSLTNCPTLVAGGGAGIVHGRHLVMSDKKTPLCNLWLSLLQGVGIPVQAFGDSTGKIAELYKV